MAQTKIQWADVSWNPITGCTPISPGCANCYAKRMANRLRGRFGYNKDEPFKVAIHQNRLDEPFYWRKDCNVFICSMGDLFHDDVSDRWIKEVLFPVYCLDCHSWMILTKRPDNALAFYMRNGLPKHLWLGVSCENQEWADKRIPMLLKIPAAVRFVSLEPLLEPIDLFGDMVETWGPGFVTTGGKVKPSDVHGPAEYDTWVTDSIDWVIVGCESGPGRRPCKLEWISDIVRQCHDIAGVPVFVKQIPINGKVSHNMDEWPKELQVREYPNGE